MTRVPLSRFPFARRAVKVVLDCLSDPLAGLNSRKDREADRKGAKFGRGSLDFG